ncbi:MAG: 2-methylisocitrate lyase-like PEP mutase family enzyme [Ilumatobacter sp.]
MTGNDLRQCVAGGPVLAPGVWDPLSALLASEAGFDTVFVSGFAVAATLLGEPDIGLLTQSEVADVARRICTAAPDLTVIVDADTGYGNERSAARTTALWEQAGASGLFLEDQSFPKRCGHMAGKEIVETADWLAKLRAVLGARTHLHVTARTDARAVLDLAEAIERGRMAADLGVDAVFVEAPQSIAEYEQIATALGGRGVSLVANMVEGGHSPLLSLDELAELGFSIVINPLTGLLAIVPVIRERFAELRREGTVRTSLERLAGFDEMTSIVGLEHP